MRLLLIPADPGQMPLDLAPASHPSGIKGNILAVPAAAVTLRRVVYSAATTAQAQAAASRLLEEELATPRDLLHFAVSAPEGDGGRWLAAVASEQMRSWLALAAQHGMVPDHIVPDCFLVPAPEGNRLRVVAAADSWWVRGRDECFSAEPELAHCAIAGREADIEHLAEGLPAWLARNPPRGGYELDLRQGPFSLSSPGTQVFSRSRRIAALAAAVLLMPLVHFASDAIRLERAAALVEQQSMQELRSLAPGLAVTGSALQTARAELQRRHAADGFALVSTGLLPEVASVAGLRVESLDYAAPGLAQVTFKHGGDSEIAMLEQAMAARGWRFDRSPTQKTPEGLSTTIALGPSP